MLTGDENIVDIDFYRVLGASDAGRRQRLPVQHPDDPGRHREGGGRKLDARGGRPVQHPGAARTRARQDHRVRGAGVAAEDPRQLRRRYRVTQVQLQKVDPPARGRSTRSATCRPRTPNQVRLQNEAQTYANQVVPQARGRAAQITQAAEGYREQTAPGPPASRSSAGLGIASKSTSCSRKPRTLAFDCSAASHASRDGG